MKNPLLGNHVARNLKKFFRAKQIPYCLNHWAIIPDDKSPAFPPLVFIFHPDSNSVLVYNKTDLSVSVDIAAATVNILFEKLLRFQLINKKHL